MTTRPQPKDASSDPTGLERARVGLFTMPRMLGQDVASAMKTLADIGYKEVEFFGPYPHSVPEAHEQWESMAESLEFSQSGYFGLASERVRRILDENGLFSPSMHIELKTLRTRLDDVVEAAHALGQEYVGLPFIPPDIRERLDDDRRIADVFNELGMRREEVGLTLLYHNHGYGLGEMGGRFPTLQNRG